MRIFRTISTRVIAVALFAALASTALATLVATSLVSDDKEAVIVEAATERADATRERFEERIALARAELRAAALASERGMLIEVPRLVSPDIVAFRCTAGGAELVDAASDAEAHALLAGIADTGEPLTFLDAHRVLLRTQIAGIDSIGVLDLETLLAAPSGWRVELTQGADAGALPGAPVIARRSELDGREAMHAVAPTLEGLAIEVHAPLASARAAAARVSQRVLLYASLVIIPVALLAWWLARAVTSPVRALAAAVSDTRGPLRLPPLPPGELRELSDAIGSMSARLDEDARGLHDVLAFARRAARALDDREVLSLLETALRDGLSSRDWWVICPRDRHKPPAGLPLDAEQLATFFELAEPSDDEPGRWSAVSSVYDVAVMPSVQAIAQGVWTQALEQRGQVVALVVGKAVSPDAQRMAVLFLGHAESALRRQELSSALGQSEKLAALGRLAASVTHEVNNPLAFVLSNLHYLEGTLEGELREAAADARVGAERVIRIVEDLSSISKGGARTELTTVDLADVVRTAAKTVRARRAGVIVDIGELDDVGVAGDRGRLEQVLVNLLANACDACAEVDAPRVTVSLRLRAGRADVEVRDTGRGIPEQARTQLFEPFFTTKGREGTGLGLYLSRAFARAHGGDVEVVETGTRGTVMRLHLPAMPAPTRDSIPMQRVSSLPPRDAGEPPRLLIVDDELLVVRGLKRVIGDRALVTGASEPEVALELAAQTPFDLVLCDLDMPGLTGEQFLARLEHVDPEAAATAIIMTGSSSFTSCTHRVLRKPIDPGTLDELLASSSARRRSDEPSKVRTVTRPPDSDLRRAR